MTCSRQFKCDICRLEIKDASQGIGIRFASMNTAKAVYLHDAETHLCHVCVGAFRKMLADMDETAAIYAQRDADIKAELAAQ